MDCIKKASYLHVTESSSLGTSSTDQFFPCQLSNARGAVYLTSKALNLSSIRNRSDTSLWKPSFGLRLHKMNYFNCDIGISSMSVKV
jgi:hypothetical protein